MTSFRNRRLIWRISTASIFRDRVSVKSKSAICVEAVRQFFNGVAVIVVPAVMQEERFEDAKPECRRSYPDHCSGEGYPRTERDIGRSHARGVARRCRADFGGHGQSDARR